MQHSKLFLSFCMLASCTTYAGTMGTITEETAYMKEGLYLGAGIGGAMYNVDLRPVFKNEDSQLREVLAADY